MLHPVGWTALVIPLVLALLIYRRARRLVGRQRVRPGRISLRLTVLAVLLMVLLTATFAGGRAPAPALVGGLALGVLLGILGVRLTRIELTAEGDFYTPNLWLGLTLTALLVWRLAYRYLLLSQGGLATAPGGDPAAVFAAYRHHAWTLTILGVVLGYYVCYYAGILLVHRRHLARAGRGSSR